jgi:RNA-directed DNA polymerase
MKRTNNDIQSVKTDHPSAEFVEKRPLAKGNTIRPSSAWTQCQIPETCGLTRVRKAAERDSTLQFTNLLHHLTIDLLRQSFYALKHNAAAGIDNETWNAYKPLLQERLPNLHKRIHRGNYRVKPTKRQWIPKPDGRQRPLGISALEDKIVQQGLVSLLAPIYEVDFLGFSYGFRPNRSQHSALDALYVAITQKKVNWIIDADIQKFFDGLDHEWLLRFVEHRIGDKRILRLIRKFLKAGVTEEGEWFRTEVGTPQGSVISPLLANIYLHYVLDLWVHAWRQHRARGEVYIIRYADDFVVCFQYQSDAQQFLKHLAQRLWKFKLTLHPDKTRLIEFGRFAASNREKRGEKRPETFDFLGFTHICSKRRSDGGFAVYRKTRKKRLRAKIKELRGEMLSRRHHPLPDQGKWLKTVLKGHMNYYGVPGNRKSLDSFRTEMIRGWFFALRKRSQKGITLNWDKMKRIVAKWLPKPKIMHPYPNQRLCV